MLRSTILTTTALVSLSYGIATQGAYAAEDISTKELLDLSLEQLSNIEVTSVSKKSEKASEAAAAIFVITQDDIRRSGATQIPDLLRMVPGLSVAQAGSHKWAVSSRGFNDHFANKLLVLIDGRSVYTPLFSGVYWDAQDTLLEDIERIEVIRGPGATLWGANAVNGVINIITKHSKDTQGGIAALTTGTQQDALMRTRYGTKIGDNGYVRAYAKYDDYEAMRSMTDTNARDQWNKEQSGFRADWKTAESQSYTLQGDIYRSGQSSRGILPSLGAPYLNSVQDREIVRGGNMLGRWNYQHSKESDVTLQIYFDNVQRKNVVFADKRNTFDFDFQHAWSPAGRHEVVWGGGYRLVRDDIVGSYYLQFTPPKRSDNLFSAFVQDKIAIVPDKFFITLGSKFERNDYTGFEYQPSARATWLINSKQTLWGSVARGVRTPNRAADDSSLLLATFPFLAVPSAFYGTTGNRHARSEDMIAYELGYRVFPADKVSLDIATFFNKYNNLVTNNIGSPTVVSIPGFAPFALIPVSPGNDNSGRTYGVEVAANWEVTPIWQLSAAYTFLDMKLKHPDNPGFTFAGKSPEQQVNLRSTLRLPHNVEVNNAIYYVDDLRGASVSDYIRFDMRVAWKPIESLELSVVGQNLLDSEHPEFTGFVYQNNAQVPRAVYGNATWKF